MLVFMQSGPERHNAEEGYREKSDAKEGTGDAGEELICQRVDGLVPF